ncbi:MAG TPA: ABC transporter permease [Ruminococcaceae bacterium]|nr:ABC transporter permease [Oscillospiraceae bacterium]HBG55286.1 ABC transporter permease [Oscillospiraceae bacterium]HBQ47121.1 ABC transporter permease [Oscillospiraceae bacterium]HBT90683.1 ABC transporter permease [Oscillospiraceae bacterium]HCB90334.1 ABC transporter permease [Oscillospiraceae bacterium]
MPRDMEIALKNTKVAQKEKEPRGRSFFRPWMLILPPAAFFAVFFIWPLVQILAMSFTGPQSGLTLASYAKFFSSPVYLKVIATTFRISLVVTLVCLVLGYPVAYAMTVCSKRVCCLLTIAVLIPFWTSLLVRTYAWMILLQSNGVVNNILKSLGLIRQPLPLMHNELGIYIGMIHILLPYMILSLYPVMKGINRDLILASRTLGAKKGYTFLHVFVPLSMPGVSCGSILVFVMSIGYYITPSLLGGTKDIMISQAIQVQVNKLMNWPFASAISIVLLAFTYGILYLSKKVMHVQKLW